MADQDPYAATALKAAASKGDPYAATAVASAPPPPDYTPPLNPSPEGFWSSVAAPFVGTYQGLKSAVVEGPQNPQEATIAQKTQLTPGLSHVVLALKRILVDPQVDQGRQAVSEFKQTDPSHWGTAITPAEQTHRELSAGHALASVIPMVGPWAASVGQKEGEQIGTENYGGASGTAIGNILLALTGKTAGKVGEVARATPEALARAVTDTGKSPVERLVAEKQAANERIDAVNGDRLERQRQDQAKADYDHRATLLKLRQQHEQSIRDATEAARTGTAEDRAKYQSKTLAAKQKYDQDVRDQTAKHQIDRAEALRANLEAERQYNQKIGETAQQNRAATEAERAKSDQATRLQVGGSQLIYGLRQLDKALRDRAGVMFDAVREKVGTASRPGTDLGTKARAALTKISGSSEVPKPFHDILTKYPEAEPDTIEYQGAQIPKTNRLYDVLKEQGMGAGAPPVTFGDLQGYYTETGAELAKGTLSGDVYQATKQLHNNIGDMMQDMANTAGAGKQFWDSRTFYRGFMDTFHEPSGPSASGSPVAQALLAKDPAVAAAKFSGDSGDRGIATLRRYSDSLANLAQDVQRTAQTDVKVPARKSVVDIERTAAKPVPAGASLPLPPVLESAPDPRAANLSLPPVLPEPKTVPVELKPRETISGPDLVAARRAAAEARAGKAQTRGTWVATWPVFQAMRALWGGHIPSVPAMMLESAGTFATTKAATTMMRYPPMIRFLTEARPADLALIPPDLRGDLPGLVNLARQQGVNVSPALIAATAGAAANTQSTSPQGVTQ